jgi:hypothetical protein
MKSKRVPVTICVECGEPNDMASDPFSENLPKLNDVSFCAECGHISLFNEDLTLREPTIDETIMLARNPKIRSLQEVHKEIQDGKSKRKNSAS